MIRSRVASLSGWGRYPVATCNFVRPSGTEAAAAVTGEASSLIARGCGRSYGDSSLNTDLTLGTTGMDRFLSFDPDTGSLHCEAGATLAQLIDTFLPRGWISPVTPGTRFVTVGGMVAADVHGKNHHVAGSFCDHVDWLDLALPGGRIERCSRDRNEDLFAATCGGLGLTGLILRVGFRMLRVESARIRQRTIRAPNLAAAIAAFEESMAWSYSVAWIDCLAGGADLGRSVLFLGEHARRDELPPAERNLPFARPRRRSKRVPIDFPAVALSALSVRIFNAAYYRWQKAGDSLVDMEPYFYPLDAILEWNRIYGRRGFVQYQCVLPLEGSKEGLSRLLSEISAARRGSFLAVLKRMGGGSFGHLSFPMPGYTLALDFPVGPETLALLDRLDQVTADHGGRLYLAKDGRASPAGGQAGYPRLAEFREVRRRWGLDTLFTSLQSQRLEL
jgi:FAD/FMN-containing dehydrogenase